MDFPLDTLIDQLKLSLYIGLPTLVICFGILAAIVFRRDR